MIVHKTKEIKRPALQKKIKITVTDDGALKATEVTQ